MRSRAAGERYELAIALPEGLGNLLRGRHGGAGAGSCSPGEKGTKDTLLPATGFWRTV